MPFADPDPLRTWLGEAFWRVEAGGQKRFAFRRSASPAPEQKLTLLALRLAILEKIATCLGTLGFIWATVVLLGGFAITLEKSDFWFITIILLIEGTRIFSRSHELEWQHQATWTVAGVGISSFRALQSSSISLLINLKRISGGVLKPILESRLRERDCVVGRQETFDRRTTWTWKNSDGSYDGEGCENIDKEHEWECLRED